GDEAINEEMFDSVERAITTDASLDAALDSDNITKTKSTVTLNEPHPQGEGLGSGPWCQETMGGAPAQTRSERVLDLEKEKDAQAVEILRLKKRVKRLERQRKSSTSQPRRREYGQVESSDDALDEEDASKQGRKNDKTNPMLHESDFDGFDDETVDAMKVTGVSIASAPVTIAGTLIKMKEEKAKEKGVAFKYVEDSSRPVRSITILQPLPSIDPKDKGKGILVKGEAVRVKRKDQGLAQIESDVELAHRLHEEELAEIERIQKEKVAQEEVSMAAIYEEYDTIQASIDADALFAAKLQQEDREQYTIKERAKFLAETIAAQRKFRAAQRAAEIKRLYKSEQKFIHDFVPMDSKKEEKKSMEPESKGKKSKRLKRTTGSYAT
ncbi:hypothetical protein Tco_1358231, partial [Tanacetum coccineum]